MMIQGSVKHQSLTVDQYQLVTDTIDYIDAKFEFVTDDWEGCTITAHFRNDNAVYDVVLDANGEITKDKHLNLSTGVWEVCLHGNKLEDDEIVMRITTNVCRLSVLPTGILNGVPLPEIPPTFAEQIVAIAGHAEQLAQSVVDAVESGELDGEDAPQIDDTQASSENPWSGAKVREEIDAATTTIDDTLTQEGEAADAKAVGDAIAELDERIDEIALATSNGYKGIVAAIRAGKGESVPNGTVFTVPHAVYGNIRFVTRAHNQHKVANNPTQPTITIQMLDLLSANNGTNALTLQYDRSEAMCKVETAIPAGTVVMFTSVEYVSWVAGTWHFTAVQQIPVGSMLCLDHDAGTALDSCSVQVYATAKDTTPVQTLTLTSGDGGATVDLGTLADDMNHPQRICYGSDNEAESNLFAWLNTNGLMSENWTQKTQYDMLGTAYPSMQGFLGGFPTDFLNCIGQCAIPNIANSVFEAQDSEAVVGSKYTYNGYFFLPSRKEIYGTNETESEADEVQFDYYKDIAVADADKLMYAEHAVSPVTYWLRTPYASYARFARVCDTYSSGGMNFSNVHYSYAIAPLAILA